MKKAIIITTVSGFVPQFEMNNVRILQKLGYEVHYASNFHTPIYGKDNHRLKGTGIICHQVDFVRSPFKIGKNYKAFQQLKNLMKKEKFALVHCHTPMGGVLGRLSAKITGTKPVIYTAHGFHFYKGASIWNWIFFYPIERWLAHYTDRLITINQEDYETAGKFCLAKNGKVEKINGVGINLQSYQSMAIKREEKRKELGIGENEFLFISVGELTKRKNHQVIIKAMEKLKEDTSIKYIICGTGKKQKSLERQIKKYHLEKQVKLLGYRQDIASLLKMSDCFIFPSKQEGLPVALLEAMAVGLPCICSAIRGNMDLAKNGDVFLCSSKEDYIKWMKAVKESPNKKKDYPILKEYEEKKVIEKSEIIYHTVLSSKGKGNERDDTGISHNGSL